MDISSSESSAEWIYYEFTPDGIVSPGSANKKVVIYAGTLKPTPFGTVDEIIINNDSAMAGFLLTMLAGIVPFPDKETIENLETIE